MLKQNHIINAGGWVRTDGSVAFPSMAALNQAIRMSNMPLRMRLDNYLHNRPPEDRSVDLLMTDIKAALMPVQ